MPFSRKKKRKKKRRRKKRKLDSSTLFSLHKWGAATLLFLTYQTECNARKFTFFKAKHTDAEPQTHKAVNS